MTTTVVRWRHASVRPRGWQVQYRRSLTVDAPAQRVWSILRDVESWPAWTPTMSQVIVHGPRFEPGATATLTQPGRRPATYTVLALDEGRRFTWGSVRHGIRQWADHEIDALDDRRCAVRLTFAMQGPVGGLLGLLGRSTIRGLVDGEADHLKIAAEAPS